MAGIPSVRAFNATTGSSGIIQRRGTRTLAVCEGDGGTAYVSRMNTGLMGNAFGGTVAEVTGGLVSLDEARMLDSVATP